MTFQNKPILNGIHTIPLGTMSLTVILPKEILIRPSPIGLTFREFILEYVLTRIKTNVVTL